MGDAESTLAVVRSSDHHSALGAPLSERRRPVRARRPALGRYPRPVDDAIHRTVDAGRVTGPGAQCAALLVVPPRRAGARRLVAQLWGVRERSHCRRARHGGQALRDHAHRHHRVMARAARTRTRHRQGDARRGTPSRVRRARRRRGVYRRVRGQPRVSGSDTRARLRTERLTSVRSRGRIGEGAGVRADPHEVGSASPRRHRGRRPLGLPAAARGRAPAYSSRVG